jgi:hypothetical protein
MPAITLVTFNQNQRGIIAQQSLVVWGICIVGCITNFVSLIFSQIFLIIRG